MILIKVPVGEVVGAGRVGPEQSGATPFLKVRPPTRMPVLVSQFGGEQLGGAGGLPVGETMTERGVRASSLLPYAP